VFCDSKNKKRRRRRRRKKKNKKRKKGESANWTEINTQALTPAVPH
jgi:hypothetical protein